MFKKYKIGFDVWALALFLAVMLPNFYWFIIAAPYDVLRNKSITPTIDIIASIFQVLMVIVLCVIKNENSKKIRLTRNIFGVLICYIIYVLVWTVYYQGYTGTIVILLLCLTPCFAFYFYAVDRKNYPALLPLSVFGVCHLAYGIINFIA